MKLYKHKPTIVEAIQWLGNSPQWRRDFKKIEPRAFHSSESNRRLIFCTHWSLDDDHRSFVLEHGDWLVRVRDEWHRVEKGLFEQLYEVLDEDGE